MTREKLSNKIHIIKIKLSHLISINQGNWSRDKMINEIEELNQVKLDLKKLKNKFPNMYEKLEYIASLTRQLSIHYKYLGLLMFSDNREIIQNKRPTLIRESVLKLYEQEVKKVKKDSNFVIFNDMMLKFQNVKYSQIFLIILGAEPSFVFKNTIIK